MKKVDREMFEALESADVELLCSKLDGGAYLEAKDAEGETPLIQAARLGRSECVAALIARGVDVKKKDG